MFFKRHKIDFPFSDMHIHILSGVDDGAKNTETMAQMLEIAYGEGIRTIVATPHYHPAKCVLTKEEIWPAFMKMQQLASERFPDMELFFGREVYYTSDCLEQLQDEGMAMADTKYVLVEFDFSSMEQEIRGAVHNIFNEGMIPILAHVERYQSILGKDDFIYELKDMGAVIQINASAVLGQSGSAQKQFVRKLLSSELVDIVATDAHSAGHRAPLMRECVQKIMDKYGKEYARQLVCDNPRRILEGAYLS